MSWTPCDDANLDHDHECDSVEMTIIPRAGDIGGFEVHRALPFRKRKMVGPFIFWDQMGPGEFITGKGVDVRPHPHIGLSTVTYLFDGSIDHRDSLGYNQTIYPGEINLMTAGSGIVHSERTGPEVRKAPSKLYGIQSWLALPMNKEEMDPNFENFKADQTPIIDENDVKIRLIMGEMEGLKSPVKWQWDTLYAEVNLEQGKMLDLPRETEERAIYILTGEVNVSGTVYGPQNMIVFKQGAPVTLKAESTTHFMVLGGAAMDGPRHIWWNFVSSSKDRLEQAKEDWKNKKFPIVPGDEEEFIPLPEV